MSDRRVTLEDPRERWAVREGYLTEQTVWWNESGSNKTTQHLTRGELQAIVNAAAAQYDIVAECTCRDEDWSPTCPMHHAR